MNVNTPVSDFDAAVRLLSGGTNVAIYNDLGLPSIYVRRDKGLISNVISGGPETVHYAFKVNGVEVPAFYMGKYLATVYKGRALSLPLQAPTASVVESSNRGDATSTAVTFDNAKIWCEANGAGFHLPTIAEYAWIALLSRKNGTMPHGNTNYGADHACQYEKGVMAREANGKAETTLSGSGPAKWNDNWKPDGICDLCGNANEWQGGYRTVNGELQIFADNNAAMQYDQGKNSTLWRAILQDGSLVDPGTDGTLKWDYVDGTSSNGQGAYQFRLNTKIVNSVDNDSAYGSALFNALTAPPGVSIPDLLKALAIMPSDNGYHGADYVHMKNRGERLVTRGGHYATGNIGGVFYVNSFSTRSDFGGFRPAFIPGI